MFQNPIPELRTSIPPDRAVATCWPYRELWQLWRAINRRTGRPGEIKRTQHRGITFKIIHWHCRPLPRKSSVSISIPCISFCFNLIFRCVTSRWTDATSLLGKISDVRSAIGDQRSTLGDIIMDYGLWRSRAAYVCQANNFVKKNIGTLEVRGERSTIADPGRSSSDCSSTCNASSSAASGAAAAFFFFCTRTWAPDQSTP